MMASSSIQGIPSQHVFRSWRRHEARKRQVAEIMSLKLELAAAKHELHEWHFWWYGHAASNLEWPQEPFQCRSQMAIEGGKNGDEEMISVAKTHRKENASLGDPWFAPGADPWAAAAKQKFVEFHQVQIVEKVAPDPEVQIQDEIPKVQMDEKVVPDPEAEIPPRLACESWDMPCPQPVVTVPQVQIQEVVGSWESLDPWLFLDKLELSRIRATCKSNSVLVVECTPVGCFAERFGESCGVSESDFSDIARVVQTEEFVCPFGVGFLVARPRYAALLKEWRGSLSISFLSQFGVGYLVARQYF